MTDIAQCAIDRWQSWMVERAVCGGITLDLCLSPLTCGSISAVRTASNGPKIGDKRWSAQKCQAYGTWEIQSWHSLSARFCCEHARLAVTGGDIMVFFLPTGEYVHDRGIRSIASMRRAMRKISMRWAGQWVPREQPSKRARRRAAKRLAMTT